MSGSFCVNSPPTSENNGKNSSDGTSTCNGGVHLCPFQLAPPINQYTYCILKRICRRILKEILSEEQKEIITVKDDIEKIQNNGDIINDATICPNCQHISSSLESPFVLKNQHKIHLTSMEIVPKSNKITQTEQLFLNRGENYNTNTKKHNFTKQMKKDFVKENINLRPQLHKSGLPLILNLRFKVRNGEMLGNDSSK